MNPSHVDPGGEALRMAHETLRVALTPPRPSVAGWVLSALLVGLIFGTLFGPAILKAMKP